MGWTSTSPEITKTCHADAFEMAFSFSMLQLAITQDKTIHYHPDKNPKHFFLKFKFRCFQFNRFQKLKTMFKF